MKKSRFNALHLLPPKHLMHDDFQQIVALEVSRSIREGGTIAKGLSRKGFMTAASLVGAPRFSF